MIFSWTSSVMTMSGHNWLSVPRMAQFSATSPRVWCDGFHQAVLDGVVVQLPGSGVGLAAAQDVGQGLVGIATLPATPVSVPVVGGSVEQDAVEPGAVDEPPVGKTGEAAPGKEVVAGVPLAGQLEGFTLVRFMLQGFHAQRVAGALQGPLRQAPALGVMMVLSSDLICGTRTPRSWRSSHPGDVWHCERRTRVK